MILMTPLTDPESLLYISDKEFRAIRDLVYERFGINLTDEKKTMVVVRLQKILRQRGFKTFHEYYLYLLEDQSSQAINELANQITTNHTFFYRESEHFRYFKNTILPEIVAKKQKSDSKDLRIWCAAASSGEEPYDIVMCMMEYFGKDYSQWDAGLLATDISEKAMNIARRGVYDVNRMQSLPQEYKNKYFRPNGSDWEIIDQVKKEVTLRRFNLMNKKLPFKKTFDCIWCRNVMIYFDNKTKLELVNRLYDQTSSGGYLLIGHSENIPRGASHWQYICPAVYKKG